MLTASDFLTIARHKLIRIVALTIFSCCSILLVPTVAFFLWTADISLLIYLAILGCSIAGSGATLLLLRKDKLEYAALPCSRSRWRPSFRMSQRLPSRFWLWSCYW